MNSRPWWLAQLWAGAALLAFAICYYVVVSIAAPRIVGPSVAFLVTASYFAPGLALSLGVNGFVMARRRLPTIRSQERVLLIIEFSMIAATISLSLVSDQGWLGTLAFVAALSLWLALLLIAPTMLILEMTSGRERSVPRAPRR
ncbi:MAG: hypothetical protein ABJA11_12100 [Pseudolysinimonas sp.]